MTWRSRIRPVLYVLGGLLVVGTLLGARSLTQGAGGGEGTSPTKSAIPMNGKGGSGPVVVGFVDTDPPVVSHGLPPVMQMGTVTEVLVKEGQEVKAGDALFAFDSTIQKGDLAAAVAARKAADAKVETAKTLEDEYKNKMDAQKLAVDVAEFKVKKALETYQITESSARREITLQVGADKQAQINELVANNPKLFELRSYYETAQMEVKKEKVTLTAMEREKRHLSYAAEAEAAVKQADALVAKATSAVDLCTVRARVPGTIEQVNVTPGMVLGIGARNPAAVVLVPSGPRIVRAEVEADFAHRIGPDIQGKEVTIYDHSDPKLTYKGTVKWIGSAFLGKRSAAEGLLGSDTRVLEARVEVIDPAPPGKPPLRVGQKVRVNFGQ